MSESKLTWDKFLSHFFKNLAKSLLIPFIVVLVTYCLLPEGSLYTAHIGDTMYPPDEVAHALVNGFARKWDGSCYGWYNNLAARHMISDAMAFVLYYSIAYFIVFFHPILDNGTITRVSMAFMGLFILCCGTIHYLDAISVVYPLYEEMATLKEISNSITTVTLVFLGLGLTAFNIRHKGRYFHDDQENK